VPTYMELINYFLLASQPVFLN